MAPTSSRMPDEMLHEIFTYALAVPDTEFFDPRPPPTIARVAISSAAILLVCRSWHRVATPLLYRVVILRSKGQAQALERTLKRDADLGGYVRRLRLEGGFGAAANAVVCAMPRVTHLYCTLAIRAPDSTNGLCRALAGLSPRHVRVVDHHGGRHRNAASRQLLEMLCACIPRWVNLKTFFLPATRDERQKALLGALAAAPRLKVLYLEDMDVGLKAQYLAICKTKSLKKIQVPGYLRSLRYHAPLFRDSRLKQLLVSHDEPRKYAVLSPHVALATNPSFIPMASTPSQIKDYIWGKIFEFGMYDAQSYERAKYCCRLQLVSKYFHRVAEFLPYRSLELSANCKLLSARINENPTLALHIRELIINPTLGHKANVDSFLRALSHATNVVHAEGGFPKDLGLGNWIEWAILEALANASGASLRSFDNLNIKAPSSPQAIGFFQNFSSLRLLYWDCDVVVDEQSLHEVSPTWLSNLETLTIHGASQSFIEALSRLELPALRRLHIDRLSVDFKRLLRMHGTKLYLLQLEKTFLFEDGSSVFDACPAITTFLVRAPYASFAHFTCEAEHTALQTLRLILHRSNDPWNDKNAEQFLADADFGRFPALREVHLNCELWPKVEHDIAQNVWVPFAERLYPSGVLIKDVCGQHWRPRLRPIRKR